MRNYLFGFLSLEAKKLKFSIVQKLVICEIEFTGWTDKSAKIISLDLYDMAH